MKLLIVFLIAFCCLVTKAQSVANRGNEDIPNAGPGALEKPSGNIRSYYVTAGDSLCVVYGLMSDKSYPTLLSRSPLFRDHVQVINTCVAGLKMARMADLYMSTVHPYAPVATGKPAILHFSMYGNDASHICPSGCIYTLESYEAALTSYMSKAIADGFQIEYLLQWPQEGRTKYDANRIALNTYLTPVANGGANRQVSWIVDANGFMKDPADSAYYLSDGLHENAAGSARIAASIEQLHRSDVGHANR